MKSFNPKEGHTRHSAKQVMLGSKNLNALQINNALRKVFIKNETTPLVRDDRLCTKLRKILNILLQTCLLTRHYYYTPYIGGDFNSRLGDLNVIVVVALQQKCRRVNK